MHAYSKVNPIESYFPKEVCIGLHCYSLQAKGTGSQTCCTLGRLLSFFGLLLLSFSF